MKRFVKIVNDQKPFTIFTNISSYIFDRVLNTPLQYASNQYLEHEKSPDMLYLQITFLLLIMKTFLLFIKSGGTKNSRK